MWLGGSDRHSPSRGLRGSITPLKKERVEKRAQQNGGLAMQCKQVNAEYGFVVAVTVSRREPFVR